MSLYTQWFGQASGIRPDQTLLSGRDQRAIDHHKVAEPAGYHPGEPFTKAAEAAARLRETPPDGLRTVYVRGDYVTPSPGLISRFRTVGHTWDGALQPEVIGGEMEGAGVYVAAAHAKVDWIVVKAICDWGFDKSDDFHARAADNAARFVVRAAEIGALDEAPGHGEI